MGVLKVPVFGTVEYERADSMLSSWILNSISKDLIEALLYTNSAKDLWLEFKKNDLRSNGPLVYQVKREISSFAQGSISLAVYFTKLKKLWDKLGVLNPMIICDCDVSKMYLERDNEDKLMQFLMGLSDQHDHIKNHILISDPLSYVNKAYSTILRVKK